MGAKIWLELQLPNLFFDTQPPDAQKNVDFKGYHPTKLFYISGFNKQNFFNIHPYILSARIPGYWEILYRGNLQWTEYPKKN
jgi:hypothetical protein